jgi:membrane-bound lytic murein transglycosylase D
MPVADENKVLEVTDIASPQDPAASQIEKVNELYEEASKKWEEGDPDAALTAFDAAYVALAQISVDDESQRSEEKSQLRLMIAQRIQEIYASHASIGGSSQFIALDENQHVQAELKRFTTVERTYFYESYQRSGIYREMMARKLREAGLPEELSWLPLIESGYKIRAYSSARALGLWQFISSTGHRYGLKKDRWVDERMDPEKATDAAVLYFKELHSYFGDWTTALASYNCGEFRIQRLIRNQKINYFDNFWDLYVMLPRETARFVPRFIATLLIVKDPKKYGMDLPPLHPPMQYEHIRTEMPFKLEQLSRELALSEETLADLNPELRHKSTPDRPYDLRVPAGSSQRVQLALTAMSKWIPAEIETTVHRVRSGDTVSGIARMHRTSIDAILRLNGLGKRHTLRIGQNLRIPSRGAPSRPAPLSAAPALTGTASGSRPSGTDPYTVKPGDTLFAIARQFQMSVDQLKSLNRIGAGTRIFPGQKLWVVSVGNKG